MNGKQIRAWRLSKNMDRKELAALCNASPATVANWELDRNVPHGAALAKLNSLMAGEVAVVSLSPQEERLLNELVARGGYASRIAFLTDALLQRIQNEDPAPLPKLVKQARRLKPTQESE